MRVPVWDPGVRLFHWGAAGLMLLDYWLLEPGASAHRYAGYALALLLALRIVWGLIGTRQARFASFWPTPTRLRHHWQSLRLRQFELDEGHNPLGALMILTLLLLMALVCLSGWLQELDAFWGEDWVQWLHERSADALMLLVPVHVTAVLLMSRYSGLRLVRTMVLGYRQKPERPAQPGQAGTHRR